MNMHTNRLINESSPYLLQHAHNPVDWYPWGEEALSKAKNENKPILVSIGYAACHWCHVMERESFEKQDIADIMNEKFVNIKIDREERPDIDHIYMEAVQLMTGSGGWPLNVFLTPDCKPFYGGTYFPPVKALNRSSWREILHAVSEAFYIRRVEIDEQAESLTEHLRKSNEATAQSGTATDLNMESLNKIAGNLLGSADKVWGGFGGAPKFPQTFSIQFLLRHYYFTDDQQALKQALLSLDKMIYGGIYDQLGGGFARYSTDREWLAPHFEKMLYDNALLLSALSEAYQLTGKKLYATCIAETVSFIRRELAHPEGGFYSALDADSEGEEGRFYTWSKVEVDEVLGEKSHLFCSYYNITDDGNWEGVNILRVLTPPDLFAGRNDLQTDELESFLNQAKKQLLETRSIRVRPLLDDKVLLNWNALMITALCKAFAATLIEDYKELALKNVLFLEHRLQSGNGTGWNHTYKKEEAKYSAFLDDYAYLAQAYLHLQEITGNTDFLVKARDICKYVVQNFGEQDNGFFFYTHKDQTDIIVRKREIYDGATPSGNAIMAFNLQYLGIVFNIPDWVLRAEQTIAGLADMITKYPTSFGVWASEMQRTVYGLNEIVVVGKGWESDLNQILRAYIPNRIIQAAEAGSDEFPLLEGKETAGHTLIYLCKNYNCKQPVTDVKDLLELL